MHILGLSSATSIISAAILDPGKKLLLEFSAAYGKAGVEDLAGFIDKLLKEAKLDIKDIGAIAVAAGPGSYSGLRGSVALAKTLSQSLNVPIVAISTLEAMAAGFSSAQGAFGVLMDAKSNEYNFAVFTAQNGAVSRMTEDLVVDAGQLGRFLSAFLADFFVVTNIADLPPEILKANSRVSFARDILPKAEFVARVGEVRINLKITDDPLTLAIKYSHLPNIREYSAS